jgi:hypothetical protein
MQQGCALWPSSEGLEGHNEFEKVSEAFLEKFCLAFQCASRKKQMICASLVLAILASSQADAQRFKEFESAMLAGRIGEIKRLVRLDPSLVDAPFHLTKPIYFAASAYSSFEVFSFLAPLSKLLWEPYSNGIGFAPIHLVCADERFYSWRMKKNPKIFNESEQLRKLEFLLALKPECVNMEVKTPLNPKGQIFETPFLLACYGGFVQLASRLRQSGAHAEGTVEGWLALGRAPTKEMVRYLVGIGVGLNEPDSEGITPFLYACRGLYDSIPVAEMIFVGADIHSRDTNGNTAVMFLAGSGPYYEAGAKVMELLFVKGADVNAVDKKGESALFKTHYDVRSIRCLLKAGANPNAINKEGSSVLCTIVESTEQRGGSNPEWKDVLPAVKELLKYKADINAIMGDDDPVTVLDVALRLQLPDTIVGLRAFGAKMRLELD